MVEKSIYVMFLVFFEFGDLEGFLFKKLEFLFCSFLVFSGGFLRFSLRLIVFWGFCVFFVTGMIVSEREVFCDEEV